MSSLTVKKKGTVIHRTTSETLRLGDYISQVRATIQTTTRKKSQATSPSCSFQITGVSLTRYDIGDDSADDLDESHTDDISRVTDNETPSFSEDSRDIDDPPIIAQETTTETEPDTTTTTTTNTTTTTTTVEETEEPPSETKEEVKDSSIGRFKVVKIESIVPFSRGRWTCFDYLDQSETSKSCCKHFKTEQNETLKASIAFDQNRVPNTANQCETNCQEPLLFSGSIKMSHTAPMLPVPLGRPPRVKIRTSCFSTPSIIPIIRPIRSVRPFFTSSASFDSVIISQDQGILRKDAKVANSNANIELVQQDPNRNIGASVSCTATIDTKIEHALDVVKNHLTHAVRLEVEDLKVKINELVDRITYLEYENDLLRANVDPDVLSNLENDVRK